MKYLFRNTNILLTIGFVSVAMMATTFEQNSTHEVSAKESSITNTSVAISNTANMCLDIPIQETIDDIFFIGCGGFF